MKYILLALTFVFSPLVVRAEISAFTFTSASNFGAEGRQTISVQSQNASGEKENTTQTSCLEVRSTSASAKFFGTSSATDPVSVLVVTMNKNSANRNFYYEDSSSGPYTFSLKVAYRPEGESCGSDWVTKGWTPSWSASQLYTVGSGGGSSSTGETSSSNNSSSQTTETSSSNSSSNQSSSGGATSEPVEPQVFAHISLSSKTLIVGAQFFISGEGYGLEKKPLESARFLWNFGDGAVTSGKSIAHTYKNPGDYLIVLDVSSGKFSGTARQTVSVIPSPLKISVEKAGVLGLVKISNSSNSEFDLSGWLIDVEGGRFIIPLHTIILPNKALIFDGEVLGFSVTSSASLLYPNGSIANTSSPATGYSVPITRTETQNQPRQVSQIKVQQTSPAPVPREAPAQVANTLSAVTDTTSVDEPLEETAQNGSVWWIIAFVALLGVATGSVFLIKRPVYNQADEFTIEEQQ